ncbi:hypothetical protein SPRG_22243 [Saprolegnia parasitica CBS 223.65]|uniref:PDZ domain-containing protein n=1 Tax=Saprolegnia parasitica (strain CBS 223.65) TaxID=695850 RepID=A0A067C7W7_SAPPC|nr:hypothetical protein SPRG_22243 [Saprolegnia parasitica CBS 223.65]KDO25230.1 hypothetical protein SPRG_22243 [Saprolegnia parasitica CBS 223.65]|eukprot:XP_012204129.1 hypothetical protein SPRG_22243 [Saprolegnia parasitica CBS 223.65]
MSWDQVKSRLSERDLPLTLTFRSSSKPEPPLRAEPARSVPVVVPEPEAAEPEPERPRRGSKAMAIPTAFALPPLLANEYNVTWSQGKLGVVVHLEEGGRAVVKERTTPSADPSTGQIEPRDELLYVNDASVASIGYNEALVRMRGKKPIHLRFRRAMASGTLIDTMVEADGPAEPYQLVWKTGPLGIVLKKNKNDEIFVQQLTNKGLSASSGKIAVGDILVAVTGVPTAPLGLAGTVDFLQCIQKPAVLDFEHRRARQPSTAKVEPDVVAPVLTAPTRAPVPSPLPSPKDSFGDDASDQQSIAMMALPDFERSTGTTVVLPGTLGETFLQPSVLLQTQSSISEETPVLDAEYQVVWTRGKLGVVIHLEDDVRAVVRETTGTATDPNLAQIQARDELIAVNGVLVADVGYAASLQAMKGPKPITLRFCKGALDDDDDDAGVVIDDEPSSTEPVIYSLLWKTGSLGIVLKLNDTDDVRVRLSSVTSSSQ